jgi:hypothetical protein
MTASVLFIYLFTILVLSRSVPLNTALFFSGIDMTRVVETTCFMDRNEEHLNFEKF